MVRKHTVNSPLIGIMQYDQKGNFKKLRLVMACHNSINRALLTTDQFPLQIPTIMMEQAGKFELFTVLDLADAFHSIALSISYCGK